MQFTKYLTASLLALAVLCGSVAAEEKLVRLTSLDWPPYAGEKLTAQGASAALVREAFKAMGYTLIVEFYPWSRAVKMAKDNAQYLGYFPEYYSTDTAKEFNFSEAMGSGPLGFAERNDARVAWKTLDDVVKYRIGVVQDYVNTEDFDQRVSKKQLQVDVTTSDAKNLQKLDGKRIDLAVVDRNVFNYLLATMPSLAPARTSLRFNDQLLEDKKLYVCFKKGPEGEKLTKLFNEGLKKINAKAIMAQHLK